MKIKSCLLTFLCVVLLAACTSSKENQAKQAVTDFFSNLEHGDYVSAAMVYGGSYETLVANNPVLNPDDHAGLWKNACTVNGYQCVTVHTATFIELTITGEYIFSVEFENPDGSLLELGACCGETPTTPPQSQFKYRVVENGFGSFLVLDLPVYIP